MPEFRSRAVARERKLLYALFGIRKWSLRCKRGKTVKERLCPLIVTMVSWLGFFTCNEWQCSGLLLSPFLPLQDNHEEDYFLYVAYSDESVYGKWAPAPQACRRDGLMEWIWGGGCWRRGRRMPEKRGRELEVNHMHNAITFHALIITIIF